MLTQEWSKRRNASPQSSARRSHDKKQEWIGVHCNSTVRGSTVSSLYRIDRTSRAFSRMPINRNEELCDAYSTPATEPNTPDNTATEERMGRPIMYPIGTHTPPSALARGSKDKKQHKAKKLRLSRRWVGHLKHQKYYTVQQARLTTAVAQSLKRA